MWLRITRSDFIGAIFFMLGLGIFVGHWISEKSVNVDHIMAVIAVMLMILGAYLMMPTNMKNAINDVFGGFKELLPWIKKKD